MTDAAQQFISTFGTLPRKAQKDVLLSLLRLPIEVPYTAPTSEQMRRAADAIFLEMDRREALN